MDFTGRYVKFFIALFVFVILVMILWRGLKINPHQIASPLVGKPLPAFQAESLFQSHTSITNANFTGKVSVLNVFATWCITCHAEHPVLMDMYHSGLVTLYGLDYKDNRDQAKAWLSHYGDPYKQVIFDPKGLLGINLGVYGTPETFVIDQHGIVRYKHIGAVSPAVWKEDILPVVRYWEKRSA